MREVGCAHFARMMLLGKVDFLRRPFRCSPMLNLALQRAQLPVRETLWLLPLQRRENRFRF